MKGEAMLDHLDGATRLYLVLGDPIAQVKSPEGLTRLMAERGHNAIVVPGHVAAADFDAFAAAAKRLRNLDGLVATVPHKMAAARHCDRLSERARLLGAANVMRREANGRWAGEMTDGAGFVAAVRAAGGAVEGRRALLVGAGGAGSAIAAELLAGGVAALAVHDADPGRRDALIQRLRAAWPAVPVDAGSDDPTGFGLVANATPAGMREADPLPVRADRLGPGTFVGDVITAPEVTPLIAAARARGCPTSTGVAMFRTQAALIVDWFLEARPAG
jgi:shikimate dehydrogenase